MRVLRFAHHAVVSAWRERERELRRRGADVALLSPLVWNEGGSDVRLDRGADRFVRGVRTLGRHPSVFLYDPVAVWRALGSRPDLIDLHEEPNALATAEVLLLRFLRGCRAPVLLYSAQNIAKRYPIPFRWFERVALRTASAAYVCNAEAGRILIRKGLRGPAVEIPLGVDLGLFSADERDRPSDPPTVGYVGRLERHKGVDVLLRAAALRPEWRVELSGDGPERATLERLAQELGIADRVAFLGFAGGGELPARYRRLDVLAVPSLSTPRWLEQFGRVAVEAMASGVPVVASDSGALPDVVADAGILVPEADPAALASGIDEALSAERWAALRAAGAERAESCSWSAVAARQLELYDDVLGSVGPAPADPDVLVVAYGPPDELDGCLAALDGALEVTVVDNSSHMRTAEVARRHGTSYVDAGGNLGFAGGVNLGLAALGREGRSARDVLLLNPDARIRPAGVRAMQRVLHSAPRIAAVGATQTDDDGDPVRVWWPFPTPARAWVEALGLGRLLERRRDFAIGSALLLNAAAVAELGGLDERFFLYAEETDWQRRARRAGWTVRVATVEASHVGGGTGGDPVRRETHFYASAELYVRKHHGSLGWQVYRAANAANAAVRSAVLRGAGRDAARRRLALFLRSPHRALLDARAAERPLRVVHVICSEAFAGAERYVQETAIAMAAEGCRVTVVGGGAETMCPRLHELGIGWAPARTSLDAVRRLLALERPDVIVTHMTDADLAGALVGSIRRIPVVSTRHFAARRGSSFPARVVAAVAGRRISGQIAISRFVAGAIEGASTVVHNGVPSVPDVAESGRRPIVLVLQRLEREKSTELALRAWAGVDAPDEWRLVIAGTGSEEAALRGLAGSLGIAHRVDFVGFQAHPEEWLQRASLFLAPAPAEPFGLSVAEAMAHGVPVVASAGGAHPETVGGVPDAALFAPGDVAAAAALMTALIRDRDRRRAYGAALRERQRESFAIAEQARRTIAALTDAVGRSAGGAR